MSLGSLLGSLDPRDHVRGKQFERVCQWFLRESPEYSAKLRHVWLWDEWPGRWGAEAGVDLIAEDTDGGLWAIQAKAYNASRAITKEDMNRFLSESSRPGIVYRLLIATTNRVGPIARRTIHAQAVPVGLLLREQLEQAQVDWPSSVDDLRPGRPKPKEPRRHTREAIAAIVEGLSRVDRGQCVMASGSGKTLVALWSSEELAARRVLVCVPSLSLLAQTLREWTANSRKPFESLAVCSDPTVASKDKPASKDELVSHPAELGVPVTTDSVAIDAFLRGKGRRVVFATYQSTPAVAAALARGAPTFDLLIADEAHRTAGPQASEFGTVLDAEAIRAKKRLFLTATPRFFTERVINDAGQLGVEVASMDDVSVYGRVLHRLTFGEAIERQILSDYRVVVVAVTDNHYRELAERGAFVTVDGRRTDARTVATEVGLLKAARRFDLRRVVSFHSRVHAARQYSAELGAVLDWMPKDERPEGSLWSGQRMSGSSWNFGGDPRLTIRR